jgi:tetraacyldisaccharide 4'-kinase
MKAWRVRLDEPAWWYREPPSGMATVLQPLATLYGWLATARYWRVTPYRSRLPVVCVGNFTAGGTGKTPLVLHLCARLKAAGHEPVALTRGYRGRLSGPYWVNAKSDVARDVGDEALLLARAAPTLVARDRRAGAQAIETGPHPATVIVMDDGLQNPRLAKDLSIAVVDGTRGRGLGNGLAMPAGPLRAPLPFQLELTDVIVVNGVEAQAPVAEQLRHCFAGSVLCSTSVPADNVDWLKGARVVAWAGIGAPERFFAMLEARGALVLEKVAFRDHHWLDENDAWRLLQLARQHAATLVTTAKDMARLTGADGLPARLAAASRVLHVKQAFAEPDGERLMSLVGSALATRR